MKERTKRFGHRCLDVVEALPKSVIGAILGKQLGRSATGVGANYRAACRARSTAEFVAKLGVVEEEADESEFWLEMISERALLPNRKLDPLQKEAGEITAIMVASKKTARR